jgi:hypothetical protein
LLCRPFRRRMSRHIEVDHTASFMGQHHKHVQVCVYKLILYRTSSFVSLIR